MITNNRRPRSRGSGGSGRGEGREYPKREQGGFKARIGL
jgi:hypothetical protein